MLTAAYETPEPYSNCARIEPRTNMFVMASLAAGQAQATVKVRNMSTRGALIEGTSLPPEGAECLLHRGDIALEATVNRRRVRCRPSSTLECVSMPHGEAASALG